MPMPVRAAYRQPSFDVDAIVSEVTTDPSLPRIEQLQNDYLGPDQVRIAWRLANGQRTGLTPIEDGRLLERFSRVAEWDEVVTAAQGVLNAHQAAENALARRTIGQHAKQTVLAEAVRTDGRFQQNTMTEADARSLCANRLPDADAYGNQRANDFLTALATNPGLRREIGVADRQAIAERAYEASFPFSDNGQNAKKMRDAASTAAFLVMLRTHQSSLEGQRAHDLTRAREKYDAVGPQLEAFERGRAIAVADSVFDRIATQIDHARAARPATRPSRSEPNPSPKRTPPVRQQPDPHGAIHPSHQTASPGTFYNQAEPPPSEVNVPPDSQRPPVQAVRQRDVGAEATATMHPAFVDVVQQPLEQLGDDLDHLGMLAREAPGPGLRSTSENKSEQTSDPNALTPEELKLLGFKPDPGQMKDLKYAAGIAWSLEDGFRLDEFEEAFMPGFRGQQALLEQLIKIGAVVPGGTTGAFRINREYKGNIFYAPLTPEKTLEEMLRQAAEDDDYQR